MLVKTLKYGENEKSRIPEGEGASVSTTPPKSNREL